MLPKTVLNGERTPQANLDVPILTGLVSKVDPRWSKMTLRWSKIAPR